MTDKIKDIIYTVYGQWPFPKDMLRRDLSEAADPADQTIIDALSADQPDPDHVGKKVFITLRIPNQDWVTNRDRERNMPNVARWKSFRWNVWSIDGQRQNETMFIGDQTAPVKTKPETTVPQFVYRPSKDDRGKFIVESIVFGGQQITGGWNPHLKFTNFVALANDEVDAANICARMTYQQRNSAT